MILLINRETDVVRLLSIFLLISFIIAAFPHAVLAEVKLDGYFIANAQSCPAYQSKNKKTNPGNIHLLEDMAYKVIAKNKFDATHYRILIDYASPQERWVAVDCGLLLTDCRHSGALSGSDIGGTPVNPAPGDSPGGPDSGETDSGDLEYLLALSWQPAFCQTHQQKNECQTQTGTRYDASNLALHGLWPQPRGNEYCGVSNADKKLDQRSSWDQLPALGLPDDLMSELIEIMPGVASFLQRHEWTKHGTCYSDTPEEYFEESMQLTLQVNNSTVRNLLSDRIGEYVSSEEIKDRFNDAFGEGAGDKVRVKCSGTMISELWINLRGTIEENTLISSLLATASPAQGSCQGGIVDAAGF